MTTYCSIRINTHSETEVSSILGLQNTNTGAGWVHEVALNKVENYHEVFESFLAKLDGKFHLLRAAGVTQDDISLWLIYGYTNQCNLEFSADLLQRIGDSQLTLCISCYVEGEP